MKKISLPVLLLVTIVVFQSCKEEQISALDTVAIEKSAKSKREFDSYSSTQSFLKLSPEFSNVAIYPLLSSEDVLPNSPDFVYGSMADGCGLLRSPHGFTLINNIEADYSIARIYLDDNLKPLGGEYILNAEATERTAQCSGTLITPLEHGFGPLFLSGGEWGGPSKGAFVTDPYKDVADASTAERLVSFGEWSTENAVVIGKHAFPGKTVAFIGDDESNNTIPSGQLGMYVGKQGDLYGGKLYGLKVTSPDVMYEMDMDEGVSYTAEFVELEKRQIDELDAEAKAKGVMGFSRLEDIDWRRGKAANNREVYFCVTGRKKPDLIGKGTVYGRVYKVVLNEKDPTGEATITCVLDGDILDGKAKSFQSPDNITVTENFAYIHEDPNGYPDTPDKDHYARLYQYNLETGELKTVLECDQVAAASMGYGNTTDTWELTGMIDVSDVIGVDKSFLLITQCHGWEDLGFTDPMATTTPDSNEGSILYLVQGLDR